MLKRFMLKMLGRKVTSAIGVVTKTVEKLEKANNSYQSLSDNIEYEMAVLVNTHMDIKSKIKENKKVISNFKTLLQ